MPETDFNDLLWFRIVAEERSFTRAAAKIGVGQSTVSHTIKRLESRMGLGLLTRTTRNVAPTEAGERLLGVLGPRMSEIEDEIAALMELRDKPSGSIRLTLSDHAFETAVWPRLKPLLDDYPEVSVELSIDSGFRNIVENGFDAGVRLGESVEKDMIAVRIGPDWLASRPVSTTIPAASKPRIFHSPAPGSARRRTFVSTGLTETARTSTSRSRGPGSGRGSSTSASACGSSAGSDFW